MKSSLLWLLFVSWWQSVATTLSSSSTTTALDDEQGPRRRIDSTFVGGGGGAAAAAAVATTATPSSSSSSSTEPTGIFFRFHLIIPWRHYDWNHHTLDKAQDICITALYALEQFFFPEHQCHEGSAEIGSECSMKRQLVKGPCFAVQWQRSDCAHLHTMQDLNTTRDWIVHAIPEHYSWIHIEWTQEPIFTYDDQRDNGKDDEDKGNVPSRLGRKNRYQLG